MQAVRPIVLSIAGYDPCGGAGVLADIKTIEQHQCLGMAVTTCITSQNEKKFTHVKWLSFNEIESQLTSLFLMYQINTVKIGLIENLKMLIQIIDFLKTQNPNINIIWDPICATTSDFKVLQQLNANELFFILNKIFLITPNTIEAQFLTQSNDSILAAKELAKHCNVLLKGGHNESNKGRDQLFYQNKIEIINPQTTYQKFDKHGSGCILSAAIASNLALHKPLLNACVNAKKYIEQILSSNNSLLAYHHV